MSSAVDMVGEEKRQRARLGCEPPERQGPDLSSHLKNWVTMPAFCGTAPPPPNTRKSRILGPAWVMAWVLHDIRQDEFPGDFSWAFHPLPYSVHSLLPQVQPPSLACVTSISSYVVLADPLPGAWNTAVTCTTSTPPNFPRWIALGVHSMH